MKVLKWIGIILLVVIVVGLIASLILPKEIEAKQSVTIDASPEVVWPMIASLKAQGEWSPWLEMDPDAEVEYSGEPATVGSKQMWDGNEDMGKGMQEITAIEPMKKVESHLTFMEPREAEGDAWITLEEDGEGSKVTWGLHTDMPIPFNLIMRLAGMKGMIEKDYKKGLDKLKEMAEAQAAMPNNEVDGYTIETQDREAKTYLAVRGTVSFANMGEYFETNMPALGAELGKQQLQMAGPPSGIYWSWDEEKGEADMAVAMPIAGEAKAEDPFTIINLPASEVLTADYYGAYDKMESVYVALDKYMEQNNIEAGEVAMEEYITDPMAEPDTAKWLTKVYFYIK